MSVKPHRIMLGKLLAFVCCAASGVIFPQPAGALPWDIDMYSEESLKSGEAARAAPEGSVAAGFANSVRSIEEAESRLSNSTPFSRQSVVYGQRLWNVNCLPCHGSLGDGKGPAGSKMGAADLLGEQYRSKTDGRVFGVIRYGLRAMPRQGYKFDQLESWDVVNYLRFLQGRKIDGVKRPAAEEKKE